MDTECSKNHRVMWDQSTGLKIQVSVLKRDILFPGIDPLLRRSKSSINCEQVASVLNGGIFFDPNCIIPALIQNDALHIICSLQFIICPINLINILTHQPQQV